MPAAKDIETSPNNAVVICKRCNEAPASQQARQDPVCDDCFIKYITTKAVKRIESYKFRGSIPKAAQKLLLPLSFGPSSVSLLYFLDQQLQWQFKRMGWTSFELHVIHVDLNTQETDESPGTTQRMNQIKDLFPKHTYSTLGIEESLNLPLINWSSFGLTVPPQSQEHDSTPLKSRFQRLIDSLPSPTSKSDMISTLLHRLLVAQAQSHNCTSILFGDSTTRLAERTLISTAAGRGFSLPWLVSDGPSPHSPTQTNNGTTEALTTPPLNIYYPLRDILKKEIMTLTTLLIPKHPTLSQIIIYNASTKNVSASDKSTTIDDLMSQYFESVEESYPSIVANVVRTSSKLVAPPAPTEVSGKTSCGVCGFPVAEGTDGMFGWGGDQNDTSVLERGDGTQDILCYGCSRSIHG